MAEGNTAVAGMARRRRTAGVGDQVMCTRKSWEPEKSCRPLPEGHGRARTPREDRRRLVRSGLSASSSANGGHGLAGLGGLAEMGFLVLPEIVHVEVAVGFKPVLVGFDG